MMASSKAAVSPLYVGFTWNSNTARRRSPTGTSSSFSRPFSRKTSLPEVLLRVE